MKADQEIAARAAAPTPVAPIPTPPAHGSAADAVAEANADAAKTRALFAELEKKAASDRELLELRLLEIKKQAEEMDKMKLLLAQKDAAAAAATAATVPPVAMNTTANQAMAATSTEQEYEMHISDIDRDSPSKPTMPKGEFLVQASQVHAWLDAWNLGGQKVMFTFQQLDDCVKLGGLSPSFCASYIGEDNFKRWFPASPPLTAIMPRQVALILFFTLDILRKELTKEKEMRAEAAASFAVLIANESEKWATSAAKKLRASAAATA